MNRKKFFDYSISQLIIFPLLAFIAFHGCKESIESKHLRLLKSAETSIKTQKFDNARIYLLNALEARPNDPETYFRLAEVLIRLKKIPEAIDNYQAAINFNPEFRTARSHLAAVYLAANRYEQAENQIRWLLDTDPRDLDALALLGILEGTGRHRNQEKARSILEDVIIRAPQHIPALAGLAYLERQFDNSDRAEELYRKALQFEPNNSAIQLALVDLYSQQGRTEEAKQLLEILVKNNPDSSSLHFIFSELLLRQGLAEEALKQYQELLLKDPTAHSARDRLYDMLLTRGRPEDAKALTAELITASPSNGGISYFKGRNAELDKQNEQALQFFLTAIKELNNFAPAFRRAGLLEVQLGNVREGIDHLNQAIAINPAEVAARLALAKHLAATGEFAQAKEHINQILRRFPRQLDANILKADIALVEGNIEQARFTYKFLLQNLPHNPTLYLKIALLEEKDSNLIKAEQWYNKALQFDQNIFPIARQLISCWHKQGKDQEQIITELGRLQQNSISSKAEYNFLIGAVILSRKTPQRYQQARPFLEKAINEKADFLAAYFALAAINSAEGNLDSAIVNYQKLLTKDANHVPTRMLLALSFEQQGEFRKAEEQYRQVLTLSPGFGPASNNLAWLIVEELNGNLDEALQLATKAKEVFPQEAAVADTLAWVHYHRKSPRAAYEYIQEAFALREQNVRKENESDRVEQAELLYHQAAINWKLGKKDEAQKQLAQAKSSCATNSKLMSKIKELQAELEN